jgi:hypothetical protein
MADNDRASCVDTLQIVALVESKLRLDPDWKEVDNLALILRAEHSGTGVPSLPIMLVFLTTLPHESSRQFFKSLEVLMVIMTTTGQTFSHIMGYCERMEDARSRRGITCDDDLPPPIPGIPAPRYSMVRWKMLKLLYQFLTSQHPITMRCVLSSRYMMMTSSNARLRFDLHCIMRGSNPRLKRRTVSPGMFFGFLKKFLAKAAKSGQSNYLPLMIDIFVQFYGLNPIMRNVLLNMLRMRIL